MRKIIISILIFLGFYAKGQTPQTPIIFSNITQMEAYTGSYQIAILTDTTNGGTFGTLFGTFTPDFSIIIPTGVANRYWRRIGAAPVFPPGNDTVGIILNNIAELQTTRPDSSRFAHVKGFYTPNDGGNGDFWWDSSNVADTVSGFIVKVIGIPIGAWIRLFDIGSRINVHAFGVKSDSLTDQQPLLQIAVDYLESLGGGIMYFPKGNYRVHLPVLLHKNMHWIGDYGTSSFIFNDRDTSTFQGDTYVYFMGNYGVPTYANTLHYTSSDTLRKATSIIKMTSAQTDSFSARGLIFIESPQGFISHGDGSFKRYYAVINRVDSIDRANGILYIEHPMDTTLPIGNIGICGKIAAGNDFDILGNKFYIADNCSIEGMNLLSSDYVAKRYGAYECNIVNNRFHSSKGVGGNGLSWCNFTNNYLQFSYKAIEYAFYSSNTRIEGNQFVYFNGHDDKDVVRPGVKFGENVRNCTVSHNTFLFGDNFNTGPVVSFDHAFDNQCVGNKIYATNVLQNVFDVRSTNDSVIIYGNYVADNEVWADSVNSFINLSRSCTACSIDNNTFVHNTFHGIPRGHAYYQGGSNNVIWDNKVDSGDVAIDSDAVNFVVNTMGYNGQVPTVMIPYRHFIFPRISGAIERDSFNLYFTDSRKIKHKIEYGDTAVFVGDSNYTVARTDRILLINAHTATRIIHLPIAATVPAGTRLLIADFSGAISATSTLNLSHAGSNTVNGIGSVVITQPFGSYTLTSDGISQWNWDAGKNYAVFAQEPIIYTGAVPSIAVGLGAGSGFTASLTGTDGAGTISITTGTGCTAGGNIVTVTFNNPLTYDAVVQLTAQSEAAGLEYSKFFIDPAGTNTNQFRIKNTGTALLDGVTYVLNYFVTQQTP